MKILFDNNAPAPLARFLKGHTVHRTSKFNWQRLENGALLDAAEGGGFDVLITCDQNIRYQQNFTGRKLALIILSTNNWGELRPVAARIASIVDFMQRGQIKRIDISTL